MVANPSPGKQQDEVIDATVIIFKIKLVIVIIMAILTVFMQETFDIY